MSGHVTTNDGGAAPSTAGEGGTAASPLGSEADLMHQHGGAAPDVGPTSAAPQPSADAIAGGMPAEGGYVRGR
jgi:hypothetical protein